LISDLGGVLATVIEVAIILLEFFLLAFGKVTQFA